MRLSGPEKQQPCKFSQMTLKALQRTRILSTVGCIPSVHNYVCTSFCVGVKLWSRVHFFRLVYSLESVATRTMFLGESEIKKKDSMSWFQTETAETQQTHLFNVMLVFSGSLGPPVSPLSKRNEKQKTWNGAWRWREAIALMHKSYHLRSKHWGHQPRGEKAWAGEPRMTDRFSSPISLLGQHSLLFTELSEAQTPGTRFLQDWKRR